MKANNLFAEATEWWLRLRDSNVAPETIGEWMSWCDARAENLAAFENVQALWQQAGKAPLKPVSPATFARVYPGRGIVPWALAAGLAAVAIAALYLFLPRDGEPSAVQLADRGGEAATQVGKTVDIVLSDGSQVKLGGASKITAVLTAERRVLKLERGEAFFKVEKDAHRPFVVMTSTAEVTALGTAFNVRTDDGTLKVTVAEGLVQIGQGSKTGTRHAVVRLKAGEEAIVGKHALGAETAPLVRKVDPEVAASWTTGTLKFMDEPLSSVVATVNRYSSRTVILKREDLEGLRFTGTVMTDRIDEWLAALPNAFPVEIAPEGPDRLRIEMRRR